MGDFIVSQQMALSWNTKAMPERGDCPIANWTQCLCNAETGNMGTSRNFCDFPTNREVGHSTANIAYMRVLSIPEIALSDHVGANTAERVLGTSGGKFVALAILMSIIGTLNGCFLTIPRIYFAQARDGLFFRRFAEVHPVHKTPSFAILAQAPWAAVLLLSGSYESLLDFSMYANWLSYAAMVAAVIVLRIRQPDLPRPYRMWGYPVTPILFIAITFWFLVNMTLKRPVPSFAALLLIITGIPVYLLWVHLRRASS